MSMDTQVQHVALQCDDKESTKIFFTKILGIPLSKSSEISNNLSNSIFDIDEKVPVELYDNGSARFEIFIKKKPRENIYNHTCIEIIDKKLFISKCKKYGLNPLNIKKGNKELLFVRDFSGNLFEIKEY